MFAQWLEVIFATEGLNKVDFSLCEPCIFVLGVGMVEGSKLQNFFVKPEKFDILWKIIHLSIW